LTHDLGWTPPSFNNLEPNELVGSVRSCQVGRSCLDLRRDQVGLVCRVRQGHQHLQGRQLSLELHPCRVRQTCQVGQESRLCQAGQLVQQGLWDRGSICQPLQVDQEDQRCRWHQVVQEGLEVLVVRVDHLLLGGRHLRVGHRLPSGQRVQLDRVSPCTRIEVE